MTLWIQNPAISVPADTYESILSSGSALTSAFDLSTIPEDSSRDVEVIHHLAVAEARRNIVYVGTPSRLLILPEDRKVVGDFTLSRFLGDGAKPSIS